MHLAQELRPDILLLHTSMPGLNAIEVAQALKTALPETRIVVLAHSGDSEELMRALLRLGVRGHLGKTASLAELDRALRAVTAGQVYVQPTATAQLYASAWQGPGQRPTPRELDVLSWTCCAWWRRATATSHRQAAVHHRAHRRVSPQQPVHETPRRLTDRGRPPGEPEEMASLVLSQVGLFD